MNTKDYIESGMLDAYALGALSREDAAAVEAAIVLHPELAAELHAIQEAMEQYAATAAKQPPAHLQHSIWNAIQAAAPPADAYAADPLSSRPAQIPLHPARTGSTSWRWAALWAALLGSTVLNIVLFSNGNKVRERQLALNAEVKAMQTQQQSLAAVVADYSKARDMMADTSMQTIIMHTVVKGHPMAATVYWSKASGATYVAMNALPAPPQGMQYQMWVIKGGQPVSMGMLPGHMANSPGMQKVDMSVTDAEAFAISLEKEGGNPTPTDVYVLGKA